MSERLNAADIYARMQETPGTALAILESYANAEWHRGNRALLDALDAAEAEATEYQAWRTGQIGVEEFYALRVSCQAEIAALKAELDRLRIALRECAEGLEFFLSKAGCPTESSNPKADAESFGYFHTLRDARSALGDAP